jgi:hypothetical protein
MTPTHPMLRSVLKSQYHAALVMLREAIERCPSEEWLSTDHKNAFWQVAYHTLLYTHLYLQPNEKSFRPWAQHQRGVEFLDGIGPPGVKDAVPRVPEPYTQAQVLDYWVVCDRMVDEAVDALDLDSPTSGFSWYRMSKLEHQFVNIRHIQHHAAQLADRVRSAADIGIRWVGARPSAITAD